MRRVAITGLGVISPVGNDIDTFWKNLTDGVCGIDFITKFDTADFKVKIAAEVKDFDPLKYIEKNDVRRMDLFTQYAMAAATQAMEDSGVAGSLEPERLGVYMGSGVGGMGTFGAEYSKLLEKGPSRISPFFVAMLISNIAGGNISIKYNARGVNLPVVTACATSAHAIGEAYRAIAHGYADAIIAGGAEAPILPISIAGFTNCMALSLRNHPQDSSIPFDRRRDGFVMGEGAAALVLEEYGHALARGATIYGEVAGYSNTCDAYHITAPEPSAVSSSRALREALSAAGYSFEKDSLYINTHGTSTPLNDKTETLAVKTVLGEHAYRVPLSSTKSMTGHMLGAAGAVEAVICALVLKDGVIPPTIGLKEKDPECDLDYTPGKAKKADINITASLSLGFGGHNACLVFRRA